MNAYKALFLFLIVCFSAIRGNPEETRLLRFPATNGKALVFSYAGNLYTVSLQGGVARKLTNHQGYEMFPRFSADGLSLAFTAQYDGNTEVYVMPAVGGTPRRITYTATLKRDDVADRMGPNNIVMTWKNTASQIVFRSRMRSFNSFIGQLYEVSTLGELPKQLPVPRGGFCSFSPDDRKMAYNRIFREFRTWKRYQGGMADDVWIFDFETKKIENITRHPAQDIIPMWAGNKVFFLSDRDKRMNLYSYDFNTKKTIQHTFFSDFDIKFPSSGGDAIVFEYAGYIYRFDLKTLEYHRLPIRIQEDLVSGRGGIVSVQKNMNHFDIAPDGKRALLGARGEIFTVPRENGPTRNLLQTSGVHERDAVWSPDGKWIAYISDLSGENEIHLISQDGSGRARQITKGADTYYYSIHWSPDSKRLLWSDRKLRLRYVDVRSGKMTEVDQGRFGKIRGYVWSPDGKWIAYLKPEMRGFDRVYFYSLKNGKKYEVGSRWYNTGSLSFSRDGKYFYFVSSRDFKPTYSKTEWNHVYQDMERVYLVPLAKSTLSPFQPRSDEVGENAGKSEKDPSGKLPLKQIAVEPQGMAGRVAALPIQAAEYHSITALEGQLYYLRQGSRDTAAVLLRYDLEKQKETELGKFDGYRISADGKSMLLKQDKSYAMIDLPSTAIKIETPLNLANLTVKLDRHQEWRQIFEESWRQMRDFLYAPNMHGVDWQKVKEKYEPLLAYVNHRNDLTYIIGEMIGELNVGHAYVGGGERPEVQRLPMGLLGAELERDARSKYYRIKKILNGENWHVSRRSPLQDSGVNVKEGDYILAINGMSVVQLPNIYQALVNTAGKQVVLRVNSRPRQSGSREVKVVPVSDEAPLYYHNWVQRNIDIVAKATGGKVGYLHIPDMMPEGLNTFVRYYYPQLQKKALVIDVRGNGGGNVSPMIIERLRREALMIEFSRNTTSAVDPDGMLYGPKITLADEYSASDGDIFTYRFKSYKLGKVVGKTTWGGVIGIYPSLPLLDGGFLYKPEFAIYSLEGREWIIEGKGVKPDVYVDNDPAKEFAGEDQQLNKAIELILKTLETEEKQIPPPPPYPKR